MFLVAVKVWHELWPCLCKPPSTWWLCLQKGWLDQGDYIFLTSITDYELGGGAINLWQFYDVIIGICTPNYSNSQHLFGKNVRNQTLKLSKGHSWSCTVLHVIFVVSENKLNRKCSIMGKYYLIPVTLYGGQRWLMSWGQALSHSFSPASSVEKKTVKLA